MQAWLGLVVLLGIAWLLSEQKRAVPWRLVLVGVLLQFTLAAMLLYLPPVRQAVLLANHLVEALDAATAEGMQFVFGFLAGATPPYEVVREEATFVLAFRALPLILVFSVVAALGWYWRILPWLVQGFGRLLQRTMSVGGGVGLGAAANVFVGMVEAPLTIRPMLSRMQRGELFVLMTCGMATVAGTVMVLYASILQPSVPGALGHILAASVISVPAAILIALIMVPVTEGAGETDRCKLPRRYQSMMDAISQGAHDGLRLLVMVAAMLVVLVALVYLVNLVLGLLPAIAGDALTLQRLLGWLFAPLAWLIGIPWGEASQAGALLGTKLVLNELVAYLELAALPAEAISDHSRLILLYALCGFANFGSLGILIGGLVSMCPERRDEILQLAPRTLVSGTLATLMTGAVIGLLG